MTPCNAGPHPSSAASTGRSSICSGARCGTRDGCQAAMGHSNRRLPLRNENARNSSTLPAPLLRPTPRDVRLNASGLAVAILCVALCAGGLWAGIENFRLVKRSERHVAAFSTEAVTTEARVIRARHRDNNRRTTIDYEYVVGDVAYHGSATVRGPEQGRYVDGASTTVTYLASEPGASWIHGRAPSRRPLWPAFAIPAGAITVVAILLQVIRLQRDLLSYGRSATAVVTKVVKKRSDKGSYWRVEYEWTLMTGARRKGRYNHGSKHPPEVGSMIPIVYDRDRPSRNRRYPLALVAVRS